MNAPKIAPDHANAIFDILLDAGATEYWRGSFVYLVGEHCSEFRFSGKLGFGGKFRNANDKWYVDYYQENRTLERDQIVLDINKRLDILHKSVQGI